METYGEALNRLGNEEFTGRSFECRYFCKALENAGQGGPQIINIYGTGGIGKTTLLNRFRCLAETQGAMFLSLDLREYMGSPKLFLDGLAALLGSHMPESVEGGEPRMRGAFELLNNYAQGRKIVLALDQYEEAGGIDEWARESFFPRLRTDTLIVIAGRYRLGGPWALSSLWRKLIVHFPLAELHYDETRSYLLRQGIVDELEMDRLWLQSSGHPLTLSLLAARIKSRSYHADDKRETFEDLLQYWLLEVSDEQLRALLYAASVSRSFDHEMLQYIMEKEIAQADFDQFTRLSFVRSSARGWQLHDLVREAARQAFQVRQPTAYSGFRERLAAILNERIRMKWAAGRDASPDIYELISQSGNPILRAHFRHSRSSENYWETLTAQTLPEARRYIERRIELAQAARILCSDPDSDEWFRYELTREESLFRLAGWDVGELSAIEENSVKLLRSPEGSVIGLAAMLPVHEQTLPYLRRSPVSAPYVHTFTEEMTIEPAQRGKFVFAIDVIDPSRRDLRSDTVNLMMEQILSGALLIASPPALPFFMDSHRSLGFEEVKGIPETYVYGGKVPAVTYQLDTRGRKLAVFLEKTANLKDAEHIASPHFVPLAPKPAENSFLNLLTPREREVAALLADGATNKEIADKLYISEAAVKKHLNAMLQKTGLKNRTQFAAALLKSHISAP